MNSWIWSLLIIMQCAPLYTKVLIFTYSYNRPDFIEIQYRTFQNFLEDDYKFVVFNDASNVELETKINLTCKNLNIECIRIPPIIHTYPYLERLPGEFFNHPTVRNVNVVQYSLNIMGFDHNDILVLLDSDVFLIKKINIRDVLKGYDLAGWHISNGHVHYLWHGLAILNMATLPNIRSLNFNCGKVEGKPIDAGGYSYFYLKNNPSIKIRWLDYYHAGSLYCQSCKQSQKAMCNHNIEVLQKRGLKEHHIELLHAAQNIEFFYNNTFLHYRGGTNWDNKNEQYHNNKTKAIDKFLDHIIQENTQSRALGG